MNNGHCCKAKPATVATDLVTDLVIAEADLERHAEARRIAEGREARAFRRLRATRELVVATLKSAAETSGYRVDEIALSTGRYVATLSEDGTTVRTHRLIEHHTATAATTANPAQDAADRAGFDLYDKGCTEEEAGIPARVPPPIAEAVADLADAEGFVPASALGAIRDAAMHAATQGFGCLDNEIG